MESKKAKNYHFDTLRDYENLIFKNFCTFERAPKWHKTVVSELLGGSQNLISRKI